MLDFAAGVFPHLPAEHRALARPATRLAVLPRPAPLRAGRPSFGVVDPHLPGSRCRRCRPSVEYHDANSSLTARRLRPSGRRPLRPASRRLSPRPLAQETRAAFFPRRRKGKNDALSGARRAGIQVGPFFPRPRISVGSGRMCLVPFVLVTSPCPFQKPPGEVSFQPASLTPECASVSESRDSCMPSPLRRWRTRPAGRPPAWRLRRVTAHHTRIVWLAGPTRGNP